MKTQKAKFSVGDSVRIFKERGTFHRGYMEDFSAETRFECFSEKLGL